MKEAYIEARFSSKLMKNCEHSTYELIAIVDQIVTEYSEMGYLLTVRQIYYQLVARGYVPNTVQSYGNVQSMLNKARLCGLIDWDAIEDRTRAITERPKWASGGEILEAVAQQYHEDVWDTQDNRVFVIVEKEALEGILERVCRTWSVPLLAARGYPSATTLRELAKRRIMQSEQRIVILHLGDHDPSGIDMSRDLTERLAMFSRNRVDIDFRRLALNMDQVEEQQPPPNPAKVTDARYDGYVAQFGVDESWELDALKPEYINQLVETEIQSLLDQEAWDARHAEVEAVRSRLQKIAENFDNEHSVDD